MAWSRCGARTGYEVQIDTETAEILQVAVRRSDLIESIHDGSYFNDHFKLWVIPARWHRARHVGDHWFSTSFSYHISSGASEFADVGALTPSLG